MHPGTAGWVGAEKPPYRGELALYALSYGCPPIVFRSWVWRGTFAAIANIERNGLICHPVQTIFYQMNMQPPPPVSQRLPPENVAFHRTELSVILGLYGRMVAAGEWRDYGISSLREIAVFSVFRRTAENPLYRIEKRPKLRMKQGMYAVIGIDGQVLKRGADLKSVLRVLERKLIRAVE